MKRAVLFSLFLFFSLGVSSAQAGTYNVANCGMGFTNSQNYFVAQNSENGHLETLNTCNSFPGTAWPATGGFDGSLLFKTKGSGSIVPEGTRTTAVWMVPEGVVFRSASGWFRAERDMSSGWQLQVILTNPDGTKSFDKRMCTTPSRCGNQHTLTNRWSEKRTTGVFTRYELRLTCTLKNGCSKSPAQSIVASSFSFVAEDNTAPVGFIHDDKDNLLEGGWIRGVDTPTSLSVGAYDAGIGTLAYQLYVKDKLVAAEFLCAAGAVENAAFEGPVYPSIRPCAGFFSKKAPVDLKKENGAIPIKACYIDYVKNTICEEHTVRIDSAAPIAETVPRLETVNPSFALKTLASDPESGVDRVEYRVGEYLDSNSEWAISASAPICVDKEAPFACDFNLNAFDQKRVGFQVFTYDKVGNAKVETIKGNGSGILVDSTAVIPSDKPLVNIVRYPERITNKKSGAFRFNSDTPGAIYECSLDKSAFQVCSSPYSFSLPDGIHTFSVRATNPGTGETSEPLFYRWNIDSTNAKCLATGFRGAKIKIRKNKITFSAALRSGTTGRAKLVFYRGKKSVATIPVALKKSNRIVVSKKSIRLAKILRAKKGLRVKLFVPRTPSYCSSVLPPIRVR